MRAVFLITASVDVHDATPESSTPSTRTHTPESTVVRMTDSGKTRTVLYDDYKFTFVLAFHTTSDMH